MSLDKNEKVTNYVNKVFADLSERIDVSRENVSDVFKKQLDSIDLNGKTTEDYRDAKITILSDYFFGLHDEIRTFAMQTYGRFLVHGVEKTMQNSMKYWFLCKACESLGYTADNSLISEDIKRNRTKIENLRPIFESIGEIGVYAESL